MGNSVCDCMGPVIYNSSTMSRQHARLCLRSFDAIGFDMDGVLAKYNFNGFVTKIYGLIVKHLTQHKGHSRDLFPEYEEVKDFCSKGVIIDSWRGNLFKCGAQGKVFRACHGTKVLSPEDISKYYSDGIWTDYKEITNNLGMRGRYAFIESLYEAPVPALFALLVNHIDSKSEGCGQQDPPWGEKEKYEAAMTDIWQSLRHIYMPAPTWPTDDVETFFEYGTEHPEEFVVPCSAEVRNWIKSLKKDGRPVFVLTSSYSKFTESVLRYIIGADYDDYFDFYLCKAGKPNFFRPSCAFPFHKIDPTIFEPVDGEVKKLEKGGWYTNGNLLHFNALLRDITGNKNMKMLYIGDGLKNDIWPAKEFAKWDTLYVVENMISEGMQGNADDHTKNKIVTASDVSFLNSSLWGSIFSDDKEETLTSNLIRSQADFAVPLLDYLTGLPEDQEFSLFNKSDPSASGYFPANPVSVHPEMKNGQ